MIGVTDRSHHVQPQRAWRRCMIGGRVADPAMHFTPAAHSGGLGTPYANVATGLEIGLFARLEPGCQAESRQLRVGERPLLEVGIRR
jgi:hypothetical protein